MSPVPDRAAPPATAPRRWSWRIWLALILLGASFPWAQWQPGAGRLSREPTGIYATLTEAFLAGQLHLKHQPDPRLETLANPYDGEQGIPRLHDHVYFNRRYYLYFGTPPVFLLFAPVRLLTGYYLPDGMGTAFFGLVGFGVGAWLLLRLKARFFPEVGEGWTVGGLAAWAFATQAQLLAHSEAVYSVPINTAFACLTAAIACSLLAWERPAQWRWLVLAGLAWGLAVAARPNYLFSLGGFVVFLLGVLLRNRELPPAGRRGVLGLLAAGILPVFLIGCGLAAYNWARFQNITEFGTSYMMLPGDPRNMPVLSLRHVPAGLYNTLLNPVVYSPYFPFALPLGKGVLPTSPILLLILALPGLWFFARREERSFWRIGGTALLATAAGNHFTICMSQTQEYRYNVDYLPAIVLLAVLICWSLAGALARAAGLRARAGRIALVLALGVTLLHALAANAALLNLPQRAPRLSRWLNYPTHWIETAVGYRYGPLRLHGRLPALAPGAIVPLVVTSRGLDILYLRYTGPDQIQVGFFHTGAGGPTSAPFNLDLSQPHTFEIDLGSLYPPAEHPLLSDRSAREVRRLRQRVRVKVDEELVLDRTSDFYPTYPGDLHIGENPKAIFTRAARFDASGFTVERLGLPAQPPETPYPLKPVRLELTFPPFVHFKREPLISTGRREAGDLLYVIYSGPNRLRFAHDSWGGGNIESWDVTYEPGRVYSLEVDMGSLHPLPAGSRSEGRLQIQLDGEPIMTTARPFHASDAAELAFGFNACESSATYPTFMGEIRKITPIDALTATQQQYGALRIALRFPLVNSPRAEPLVVSGRPGAGDFIYVVYASADTIRLGYDHWGVGGPLTDPIPVNYEETHLLEISMGSLFPPVENDAAWDNLSPETRRQAVEKVSIKLNGRVVLEHRSSTHPAKAGEVTIGGNPVGGSTCEQIFTGQVLLSERIPPRLSFPPDPP